MHPRTGFLSDLTLDLALGAGRRAALQLPARRRRRHSPGDRDRTDGAVSVPAPRSRWRRCGGFAFERIGSERPTLGFHGPRSIPSLDTLPEAAYFVMREAAVPYVVATQEFVSTARPSCVGVAHRDGATCELR